MLFANQIPLSRSLPLFQLGAKGFPFISTRDQGFCFYFSAWGQGFCFHFFSSLNRSFHSMQGSDKIMQPLISCFSSLSDLSRLADAEKNQSSLSQEKQEELRMLRVSSADAVHAAHDIELVRLFPNSSQVITLSRQLSHIRMYYDRHLILTRKVLLRWRKKTRAFYRV